MKKWLCLLLAMLLCFGAAQAEGETAEELFGARLEEEYPGWRYAGKTGYLIFSDGKDVHCTEAIMLRVEEEWLRFRILYSEDDLAPSVYELAPVPLTPEASQRLSAVDPAEFSTDYTIQIGREYLPGCAELLLNDGERMTDLLIFETMLVATVVDGAGREGLRIAHWDGEKYVRVTATEMGTSVTADEYHSSDGCIDFFTQDADFSAFPLVEEDMSLHDAPWQIGVVLGDEGTGYVIEDDRLCEYEYLFFDDTQHNDRYRYGKPTFPVMLEGLEIAAVPLSLEEATPLLDASGFACTKQDGVPMYDAPEGTPQADCYARLVGTVQAEEEGWVQLLIGSEEKGMKAWFHREDLLFDADVNTLYCGFPSFKPEENWDAEQTLPGVTEKLAGEELWGMQLIASTEEGGWLVLVNEEFVMESRMEGIKEIGPAWCVIYEWVEVDEEK